MLVPLEMEQKRDFEQVVRTKRDKAGEQGEVGVATPFALEAQNVAVYIGQST